MLSAPRLTAVRLAVAAALGGVLGATGCTSLLGIDGKYTDDLGGGGKSRPTGDSSGEGGTGAGGESVDNGGTGEGGAGARGSGGAASDTDGSTPVGAGGAKPDPGCMPGKYVGTVNGRHAPSFAFVPVPLGLSGPLSFELTGAGGKLEIATGSGKIDAVLTGLPKGAPAALVASVEGTYDCSTHQLAAKLSGTVNAGLTPLEGTLTGDLTASSDTARTWQEAEVTSSGPSMTYKGSGTWNATGP